MLSLQFIAADIDSSLAGLLRGCYPAKQILSRKSAEVPSRQREILPARLLLLSLKIRDNAIQIVVKLRGQQMANHRILFSWRCRHRIQLPRVPLVCK